MVAEKTSRLHSTLCLPCHVNLFLEIGRQGYEIDSDMRNDFLMMYLIDFFPAVTCIIDQKNPIRDHAQENKLQHDI
jgi:hypothetical protein